MSVRGRRKAPRASGTMTTAAKQACDVLPRWWAPELTGFLTSGLQPLSRAMVSDPSPAQITGEEVPACMQNHPALNKHPRPPQGSGVTGQRYPLRILSPWGCSPLPGRLKGLIHLLTHSTKAHRAGYLGYAREQSQDTCLHRALVQYQREREKFFKCI